MGGSVLGSGADFDDLAFEDFQGFLNQRVVLKIVFVEGHWSELLFHCCRGGSSGSGGASGPRRRRLLRGGRGRHGGGFRLERAAACGGVGSDEPDLGIRTAES